MNLENSQEAFWRDAQCCGHPPAVFRDMRRIVVRADAAIQAAINAFGDAALAAEEGVPQAGDCRQQRGFQHHGVPALSSPSPLWGGKAEAKRRPGWGSSKTTLAWKDFRQNDHP